MDPWHSTSKCDGLVSPSLTTRNGRQACNLLWSTKNWSKYRCSVPFAEQLGGQSRPHLHSRKRKFICDSICEVLGSVRKLQENEKVWRGSCICFASALVYEIMPTKKLDIERVLNREICDNDWYFVETVLELKDSDRSVINPSIILPLDISWVFYHIKRPDHERYRSFIPNRHACLMDLTKNLQYRLVASVDNSINVHKEII